MFTDAATALAARGIESNQKRLDKINAFIKVTPDGLINTALAQRYVMLTYVPSDFAQDLGGSGFVFSDLEKEFKKVCRDYTVYESYDTGSFALGFATKMIYEIGPASRQVKAPNQDKCWSFDFYEKEGEDDLHVSSITVSTFKNNPPSVQQPTVKNNILTITMKQAGNIGPRIEGIPLHPNSADQCQLSEWWATSS